MDFIEDTKFTWDETNPTYFLSKQDNNLINNIDASGNWRVVTFSGSFQRPKTLKLLTHTVTSFFL